MIANNNLSYIKDNDQTKIWSSWNAVDRDLFILNKNLIAVDKINLTDSFDSIFLQTIVDSLLNN